MICGAVVIGGSAGGLMAMETILKGLPGDFVPPVLLVEHLSANDAGGFAEHMTRVTGRDVIEASDKLPLEIGHIYSAPANYHLLVERDGTLALNVDDRVNWCRPSIDVLFESAAEVWGCTLVGVLLSGANSDGAQGVRAIRAAGGRTLVQDPASAESRAMPEAAIATGSVDEILTNDQIAPRLLALCAPSPGNR